MLVITFKVVGQMFLPIQAILSGGATTPYCVVFNNPLIFGTCCEEDGAANITEPTYCLCGLNINQEICDVGDVNMVICSQLIITQCCI
jgi:hypothetical protein